MEIYDLPRGAGKTTRAMIESEDSRTPILCSTHREKEFLIQEAERRSFDIPKPITISDLRGREFPNGIIIDEVFDVLRYLISEISKRPVNIKAVTFSSGVEICR